MYEFINAAIHFAIICRLRENQRFYLTKVSDNTNTEFDNNGFEDWRKMKTFSQRCKL